MPYAEGRRFCDADSHVMELPEWIASYADPGVRERLRPMFLEAAGRSAEKAIEQARSRDAEATRELEKNVMGAKGWAALGASDPSERSRALDLLGFDRQLLFPTFAASQFRGDDPDLLYGGSRALNRAIAEFAEKDPRLASVGYVPWGDPARVLTEAREAIRLGCDAIQVPSAPQGDLSPTHPDYHPFWALLEETGIPFMLHIGGGGRPLPDAFRHNGLPKTTDFLGGGENIRSKDYLLIYNPPEIFLSCLVLDGVLERFPGLRGGCIEQGALWVVPWLLRLDLAQDTFRRTEPALALPLRASEYVRRQLWFTPFPTEPVGWMTEQSGEDLFLFSSDYPHPEGGRHPIKHFESSMAALSDGARDRFYAENFDAMLDGAA